MKYRLYLTRTLAIVILSWFQFNQAGTSWAAQETRDTPAPNIIFVFADDMGFGDLGCYGHRLLKTPFLDRMASEGLLFTNFTTSSPVCSPSRTGIMTGQYPARHRIHYALSSNGEYNERYSMPDYIDPGIMTVTKILQSAGYVTAHFGKWHLGATPDAPAPQEYGIDERSTHTSRDKNHIYAGVKAPDKTERIIDVTIDFVERHKDEPFYINCWLHDPHGVLAPSPEQRDAYPELKSRARGFTGTTQVYYAVISNIDRHIGRLLDKLDELGLSENTLVIFSSDNGPSPIWGIGTAHSGAGGVGPLRGCKASLYEGGIRVPFIVRWRGHIPAGDVDDNSVISGVDLLPTFCSLAGVSMPEGVRPDGEDMSRALLGTPTQRSKPLMWQYRFGPWGRHFQKSPALAMREGDWKLMMNPDGSRTELYNLKENPCEVDNLANEYPEIVRRMSRTLSKWHTGLPDIESMPANTGSFDYPWPGTIQ
jgi:N-acetylgalactosamine-6-sulfatase